MMKRLSRYMLVFVALLLLVSASACSMRDGGEATVSPTEAEEDQGPADEATALPSPTEIIPTPEPTEPPAADVPDPTEVPDGGEGDAPEGDTGGDGGESPEPTEESPPTEAPPPPEDPINPADIPELELGSLDPVDGGLSSLGTFRQRMTVDFVGQETGYSGVYVYESEVNAADQAIHVTINAEGEAVQELPANQLQAIWVEDNLWIKIGNQPWLPVPAERTDVEFDQQFIGVGGFLPYARVFERVGEEDMNGIPCAHYSYDAEDLPTQSGTFSGRGDIYVALEGGYVVRYTLSGSGTFDATFQGSGTIDLVYDTYDVGAEIVIRSPRR